MTKDEALIREAKKLTGPEKHLFRMAVLSMRMEPGDPEYYPRPVPVSRVTSLGYMLQHDVRPGTARKHLKKYGERLLRQHIDLSDNGGPGGIHWIGAIDYHSRDDENAVDVITFHWVTELIGGLVHLQNQYRFEEKQRLQGSA